MPARSLVRYLAVLIVGPLALLSTSAVWAFDFGSFKTDAETDRWLRENSATYARITMEIKAMKDVRGYRFATTDKIRRGMMAWVDGYLEIQLNPSLSGADRVNTLIFEMANASRHPEHRQIDLAADEGLIRTPEEFGLAHEIYEYEALRIHRQILVEMESRAGPLPMKSFSFVTPPPRSLKEYQLPDLYACLKAQKESGHMEHYYKAFHLRKPKHARPQESKGSSPSPPRNPTRSQGNGEQHKR